MTVHMVRIFAEKPDGVTEQQANDTVDEWVQDHTEWEADTTPHEITTVEDPNTGAVYFRGDYRFEQDTDYQTLLDDAETALSGAVSWYRIGYHECTHDGTGGKCSWDSGPNLPRKNGTVPEYIPDLQ